MVWYLDGQAYDPIPIVDFRRAHGLPKSFGVAYFQPKDFTGLASLEGIGSGLTALRDAVLQQLPARLTRAELLPCCDTLTTTFERALSAMNPRVGLRESELGYAVANFRDFLLRWAFAAWDALAQGRPLPPSRALYMTWLEESLQVESSTHPYPHGAEVWRVRIVHDLYGRAGLFIDTGATCWAVADSIYSCPANAFMGELLCALADKLAQRLAQQAGE